MRIYKPVKQFPFADIQHLVYYNNRNDLVLGNDFVVKQLSNDFSFAKFKRFDDDGSPAYWMSHATLLKNAKEN